MTDAARSRRSPAGVRPRATSPDQAPRHARSTPKHAALVLIATWELRPRWTRCQWRTRRCSRSSAAVVVVVLRRAHRVAQRGGFTSFLAAATDPAAGLCRC